MGNNPNRKRKQVPYKEQDGMAYIRVQKAIGDNTLVAIPHDGRFSERDGVCAFGYDDTKKATRIISSRRVEDSVLIADYLDKCSEAGMFVTRYPWGEWVVQSPKTTAPYTAFSDSSLKAAYHRCTSAIVKP